MAGWCSRRDPCLPCEEGHRRRCRQGDRGGRRGGHAGTQSPFSLVREIREFWDGVLVLGGAMSDGASARAAEIMGADFAYMNTRLHRHPGVDGAA